MSGGLLRGIHVLPRRSLLILEERQAPPPLWMTLATLPLKCTFLRGCINSFASPCAPMNRTNHSVRNFERTTFGAGRIFASAESYARADSQKVLHLGDGAAFSAALNCFSWRVTVSGASLLAHADPDPSPAGPCLGCCRGNRACSNQRRSAGQEPRSPIRATGMQIHAVPLAVSGRGSLIRGPAPSPRRGVPSGQCLRRRAGRSTTRRG